ncbi:MAG: hypothetical protein J6W75_13110 [Bacteroidaceae bacterium]|nr:hypothetical protein [Bacteroidaceae bacterium]
MKIQKLFWTLMVAVLPLGFAACSSDDDGGSSQDTTPYVYKAPVNKANAGKWEMNNGGYVNLDASNTVTLRLPRINEELGVKASATRGQDISALFDYIVGEYKKNGDLIEIYVGGQLWGTVKIVPNGNGKFTVVIQPKNSEPIEDEASKKEPVASSSETEKLCRTWKPYEIRINVLKPGATSWIGRKAIPDFDDVKKKAEEEGCHVDDDFGKGYAIERISFDDCGSFTIGFDKKKNPDAKDYVGSWRWEKEKEGLLHYDWADDNKGKENSFATGEAQIEHKVGEFKGQCWLHLKGDIEDKNEHKIYKVDLIVCMYDPNDPDVKI